jgi:hypothetical protein
MGNISAAKFLVRHAAPVNITDNNGRVIILSDLFKM